MTDLDLTPTKVCPIILRLNASHVEILAFRHPIAGCQLVKGSIEPGEEPEAAAIRELREESGINSARVLQHIGPWESEHDGQIWTFFLCHAEDLENEWRHRTGDDGGLVFEFFWQPISAEPGEGWHPVYQRAIKWLLDK